MNIQSLIGKLKHNKKVGHKLTVVVQPGELYFSALVDHALPSKVVVEGGAWQETLLKTLIQAKLPEIHLDIVLNSKFYQTYQIDKPNIPEAELAGALPFLLKDLISEKVTDIVADAAELPVGNKLQVYVVPKSLIFGLQQQLSAHHIQLDRVLVEDEVWGVSAGEVSHFLLLQRSKQSSFRVSAFVDHHCAFQRTIRGVASPLTGVATSVLQLDGIALELQRSIDYLSSQLRGASLHQMKVCCDEEDQPELVEALSERLSVKVAALSENDRESGDILIEFSEQLSEQAVNLYPDSLKPKKENFTLTNVVFAWGAVAAILLTSFAYLHFQQSALNQELEDFQIQQREFEQQLASLNERLAKHKPSAAKVAAVARLKLDIQAKRASLKAVDEFDDSQQIGYSGVMRALAELGREDISLNHIFIDANTMDLQGLAREAKAIPNWVNQFQSEVNLVGRTFEKLRIGRNDDDIVTFELITKQESK
ncbi:MSHA biogenesis protein MshI [Vibrio coralliilyticus]|uniref:MSHA biogenesis protein MshI n=1 Tax=Vibrio coralliilyticus TaxID=190893 RepID=A0AAN0SEW7_9VIBR|nr:MSHA biogenesis protein MshI [Vibrio coralliilyticus]AIW20006.1 MSHA biogenesis protein MshI [Vibrio coralliilyticus]NOH40169.1 MSHA biogenesis protein MshI [Vibrio coralliilyticus]